jgi:hypothetical protein
MSFSAFIRDTAYFQIRRDQQMVMNAEDFDLQFNKIINYINTKIVPIVNNLGGNNIAGTNEPNTANTFLRNIGDGTTEWSPINNNAINDYSIAFSKIIRTPANAIGSIFATGADRAFRLVVPTAENQTLIARNNNLPAWQKLKAENFFDRTIDGTKIAYQAIGLEHLSAQVTGRGVEDNAVLERHVADQVITSTQIVDGALVASKIKQDILDARKNNFNSVNFVNFIPDNAIENRHITNGILDNLAFSTQTNFVIADTNNINEYAFTPDMIEDNTLTAQIVAARGLQLSTSAIMNGAVEPKHMIANSLSTSYFSNNVKIRKEKLNAAIRAKLGI